MTAETAYGVIATGSFDEHVETARDFWNLEYTQLAGGRFRSKTTYLSAPRTTLYHESWNRPLHIRGELGPDQVGFAVPDPANQRFRLWGRTYEGVETVPYLTSAGELDLVGGADHDNTVVVVAAGFLEDAARRRGHDLDVLGSAPMGHLLADPQRSEELRRLARAALSPDRNRFHAMWSDTRDYEEELVDVLLSAIVPGQPTAVRPARASHTRRRLAGECLDIAREHDFQISIPELRSRVSASRRTIEYAFRDQIGVSPARYFRLCRYRRAVISLAAANREEVKIFDVAIRHGFTEMGRFSVEYRRLFGEKPSETLRRPPTDVPRIPGPGC